MIKAAGAETDKHQHKKLEQSAKRASAFDQIVRDVEEADARKEEAITNLTKNVELMQSNMQDLQTMMRTFVGVMMRFGGNASGNTN